MVLVLGLLAVGCDHTTKGSGPEQPPPDLGPTAQTLAIDVHAGGQTPPPLEWAAVVGSANGQTFVSEGAPGALPSVSWSGQGTVNAVAFGGPSSGATVSQAFAQATASTKTLDFGLGADLVANAVMPTPPAGGTGAGLFVDTSVVKLWGSDATGLSVHIYNFSSTDSAALHVTAVGPAKDRVSVENCVGGPIAAGASCAMQVMLAPDAAATVPAVAGLAIDGGGPLQSIVVVGYPWPLPTLSIAGSSEFGTLATGETVTNSFTFTYTSGPATSPITLSLAGADAASFTLDASGCAAPLTVGSSCTANVTFAPTTDGALQASLVAQIAQGFAESIPLAGTAFTPQTLSYTGATELGPMDEDVPFDIKVLVVNNGTTPSGPLQLVMVPSGFVVFEDECGGKSLPPGQSCLIDIEGVTMQDGQIDRVLVVSGTPGGTLNIPISMTVGHYVEISALGAPTGKYLSALTLPSQQTPVAASTNVTIHNVSTMDLPLSFTNVFTGPFLTAGAGTCGTTLAAGASCDATLSADYTAQTFGAQDSGELNIRVAGLHNIDVGAWYSDLQVTPSRLALIGKGASGQITVTNVSNTTVSGLFIDSNLVDVQFPISGDTCTGATLAPQQSCTVTVTCIVDGLSIGGNLYVHGTNEGSFTVDIFATDI
jgi:hypothetical protein